MENQEVITPSGGGNPKSPSAGSLYSLLFQPRSEDAILCAKKSEGAIVLREDGKVDFPKLGLYGGGLLKSNEPTDKKDWSIVQGGYIGSNGSSFPSDISYFTPEKAKQVVEQQGLILFEFEQTPRKVNALLKILGPTEEQQIRAFISLFGDKLNGGYGYGCWNPVECRWEGIKEYEGGDLFYVSYPNDGMAYLMGYNNHKYIKREEDDNEDNSNDKIKIGWALDIGMYAYPVLAFERIEKV